MTYELEAGGAIRDQKLVGETVVLAEDKCRAVVRSTLTRSVIKFDQPKSAGVLVLSTFEDCLIEAIKPQRERNFFLARFINCRFRGTFKSVKFGRGFRAELQEDFGTIEGCDFTDAVLDDCEFVNVDVSTIKFPQKDHVVLIEPYKRAADVAAVQWPGDLARYMLLSTEPQEWRKAAVDHVPSLARHFKCTPDELRRAFKQFGGVLM